jgi:hypothetical protein
MAFAILGPESISMVCLTVVIGARSCRHGERKRDCLKRLGESEMQRAKIPKLARKVGGSARRMLEIDARC